MVERQVIAARSAGGLVEVVPNRPPHDAKADCTTALTGLFAAGEDIGGVRQPPGRQRRGQFHGVWRHVGDSMAAPGVPGPPARTDEV
jgi:hypothetical protein